MRSRARRRGLLAAQVAVGLGVLAVLVSSLEWDRLLEVLADASWGWIGVAIAVQVAGKVAWAYRWREILRAFGVLRRLGTLTILVLVGLFFSAFLPGGVGGDLARGYYVTEDGEELVTSYSVVLLERLLGVASLAGLGVLAGGGLLLAEGGALPPGLLGALTGGAGVVALLGAVPFVLRDWDRVLGWTSVLGERAQRIVSGLAEGRHLFRRPAVRAGRVLSSTFLMQVAKVLFAWACARAVGLDVSLPLLFLVVPAALVVAMVPVTLNGLGLREASLVGLLVAGGTDPELAGGFALLSLCVATAFAAVGGVLFVSRRWLPAGVLDRGDRPATFDRAGG